MTIKNPRRAQYTPLRPELDQFLFGLIGSERDGIPLSTISALTQLGLDPWDEASRLASVSRARAIDQLMELILKLPGAPRSRSEAQEIAAGLIDLLPPKSVPLIAPVHFPENKNIWGGKSFWVVCFLITALAVCLMIASGNVPLGQQKPFGISDTLPNPK